MPRGGVAIRTLIAVIDTPAKGPHVARNNATPDRRAVIADLQRKNKRQGLIRNWGIVGACVIISIALLWIPVAHLWKAKNPSYQKYDNTALQDIGSSPQAAMCGASTKIASNGHSHVTYPQTVQYTTAPVAFGNHWNVAGVAPVAMQRKFYTTADRPPLEALVHNLEHGYTILWYDATISGDALDQVHAIANKFAGTTDFRDKFIAVPWTSADAASLAPTAKPKTFPTGTHIGLTHWETGTNGSGWGPGVFQYCGGVSGQAVKNFMQAYPYTDSPEPPNM